MSYIHPTRPAALNFYAGPEAFKHIQRHGLRAEDIDLLPGAAGGPKGIGIQGLDHAIFHDFLPRVPKRRTVIGASIGSWRFASILAHGALEGTARLAEAYTHLSFQPKMTYQAVSAVCETMLESLIQGHEQCIVEHPDYHFAIVSAKAKHIFQSDRKWALLAALAGVVGANSIHRKHLNLMMQRVISQPSPDSQLDFNDGLETLHQTLDAENLTAWLMASASIPAAMAGVKDIPSAPTGVYRDGGLIDYHFDMPFKTQGLVLYPHFTHHVTPGWFDKLLPHRKTKSFYQNRTLLVAPSNDYLASLPLGRLPDRKDFSLKGLSNHERIRLWTQSVAESQRLRDEFLTRVERQDLEAYLQPIRGLQSP